MKALEEMRLRECGTTLMALLWSSGHEGFAGAVGCITGHANFAPDEGLGCARPLGNVRPTSQSGRGRNRRQGSGERGKTRSEQRGASRRGVVYRWSFPE